jgi:hypothetical protein
VSEILEALNGCLTMGKRSHCEALESNPAQVNVGSLPGCAEMPESSRHPGECPRSRQRA